MKLFFLLRILSAAIFFTALLTPLSQAAAQSAGSAPAHILTIDATHALEVPSPIPLGVVSQSPGGHTIALTDRYMLVDGKPALPVMGEFQFSRYPEQYWDEELLKMKAAGVQIVSTYIFWIHHEEVEGEFDWSGNRDLRHFAELCKKDGLLLFVRVGPYVHGEARNGGLPDWVLKEGPIRSNDPLYLSNVRSFYQQIGVQLRGQLWKDGGSVIGVQVENEYFKRGSDAGAAHISELKKLAIEAGLEVPLYTVTGWGDPDFPAKEVIPVFGVYPDAFWESSLKELPPNEGYSFSFRRDLGGIATDPQAAQEKDDSSFAQYPYFLAEAGGGMQVAYHRRPVISADDVAALWVTHIGAGANLYGYYLFHGESNPLGKLTTMQESAAVDGYYDLPIISYDFQAPLGEFGQVRPSYRVLKEFHLFLNDFGGDLASMIPVAPSVVPSATDDLATPRFSARIGPQGGFLFFNNYVREYPMQRQENLRMQIKLPGETISLPRQSFDVPSGSYFVWPLNLNMNGVVLRYATAQLLCRLEFGGESYYFFFPSPGIAAEFAIDSTTAKSTRAFTGKSFHENGEVFLEDQQIGTRLAATIISASGQKVNLVLLSPEEARNTWKAEIGGKDRVMLSAADVFFDGETIDLRSRDPQGLDISAFPPFEKGTIAPAANAKIRRDGIFTQYSYPRAPAEVSVQMTKLRSADPAPPVKKGKYNALAPTDQDFAKAAQWRMDVPESLPKGCSDLFLEIHYQGDVAHLYQGGAFIADDFYHGEPWEIGLKRFMQPGNPGTLQLSITPLRKDAPIFLEPGSWPSFPASNQVADVEQIRLIPEYEIRITIAGKTSQ